MLRKVGIITSGMFMAGVAGLVGHGETLTTAISMINHPNNKRDRK